MMANVIKELITYGVYVVTTNAGVTTGWMSAGRAQALKNSIGEDGS